jgi:hypothetical protein
MTISERSQLMKLVKALLDLIEEDPDFEVIEPFSNLDRDNAFEKGGPV